MAEKDRKFTPVESQSWRAMHALRSSNAATPHKDKRTKRARTRDAAKRVDIRTNGW